MANKDDLNLGAFINFSGNEEEFAKAVEAKFGKITPQIKLQMDFVRAKRQVKLLEAELARLNKLDGSKSVIDKTIQISKQLSQAYTKRDIAQLKASKAYSKMVDSTGKIKSGTLLDEMLEISKKFDKAMKSNRKRSRMLHETELLMRGETEEEFRERKKGKKQAATGPWLLRAAYGAMDSLGIKSAKDRSNDMMVTQRKMFAAILSLHWTMRAFAIGGPDTFIVLATLKAISEALLIATTVLTKLYYAIIKIVGVALMQIANVFIGPMTVFLRAMMPLIKIFTTIFKPIARAINADISEKIAARKATGGTLDTAFLMGVGLSAIGDTISLMFSVLFETLKTGIVLGVSKLLETLSTLLTDLTTGMLTTLVSGIANFAKAFIDATAAFRNGVISAMDIVSGGVFHSQLEEVRASMNNIDITVKNSIDSVAKGINNYLITEGEAHKASIKAAFDRVNQSYIDAMIESLGNIENDFYTRYKLKKPTVSNTETNAIDVMVMMLRGLGQTGAANALSAINARLKEVTIITDSATASHTRLAKAADTGTIAVQGLATELENLSSITDSVISPMAYADVAARQAVTPMGGWYVSNPPDGGFTDFTTVYSQMENPYNVGGNIGAGTGRNDMAKYLANKADNERRRQEGLEQRKAYAYALRQAQQLNISVDTNSPELKKYIKETMEKYFRDQLTRRS